MPPLVKPDLRVEVNWSDSPAGRDGSWPSPDGYPPTDVTVFVLAGSVGVGTSPIRNLLDQDVRVTSLVRGSLRLADADGTFTIGQSGRASRYEAALTGEHAFRLRVGSYVVQTGRARIVSQEVGTVVVDVRSLFEVLIQNPSVEVEHAGGVEASVLARAALTEAGRVAGLPVPGLAASVNPNTGGGVASVLIGGSSVAADLEEAPLLAVLDQMGLLLCGGWFERWDGGVEMFTWLNQLTAPEAARVDGAMRVKSDRLSVGRGIGLVRNRAHLRTPSTLDTSDTVSYNIPSGRMLSGSRAQGEVRWTPGNTAPGSIRDVGAWETVSAQEVLVLIRGEKWDVWDPLGGQAGDRFDWRDHSTVVRNLPGGDKTSRFTTGFIRISGTSLQRFIDSWNDANALAISLGQMPRVDGTNVDFSVQLHVAVTRNVITQGTIDAAGASAPYHVYPALANTVQPTATFGNADLVRRSIEAWKQPLPVGSLPIGLWHRGTADAGPERIRMGDRIGIAVPGVANHFAVVTGLEWSLRLGQEPTVTVTYIGLGGPQAPIVFDRLTLGSDGLTLGSDRLGLISL